VKVALSFDTEFPGRPHVPAARTASSRRSPPRDVRGSFFLQGRWTRAYPELARRIAAAGHLIGNHSNFHAPMNGSPTSGSARRRARRADDPRDDGHRPEALVPLPVRPRMDDARVLNALDELGYRHVGWDVDPRDWDETRTVDELVKFVVAGEGSSCSTPGRRSRPMRSGS
jgi:peptidoglycan/xylan/chitin deacetylase (PgdA/CDA1 family)